jgi:ribosomal protein S18 acetylase RimI-like enzyme
VVVRVRQFEPADAPVIWTLSSLPNVGETADTSVPLPLPAASGPPRNFPDLADVPKSFIDAGGAFLVVDLDGHLAAMGGFRPNGKGQAEILRVRVHPATRRRGIGRALMDALEERARSLGLCEMTLDTATNQPESMAFYRALGYVEVGRESHPEWSWTLVYFRKPTP